MHHALYAELTNMQIDQVNKTHYMIHDYSTSFSSVNNHYTQVKKF